MRIYLIFIVLIALSWPQASFAQNNSSVSWSYTNIKLERLLSNIEHHHHIQFSYVKSRLPLSHKVSIHVSNVSLEEALQILFSQNQIEFAQIGSQWVLKPAKVKKRKLPPPPPAQAKPVLPPPVPVEQDSSELITQEEKITPKEFKSDPLPTLTASQIPTKSTNAVEKTVMQRLQADVGEVFASWKRRKSSGDLQVFQLSTLGTGKKRSQKTNVLGLSLGWGVHGSVEGVQVSVLGTHVRRKAYGLQAAGLFNSVGDDAFGLQVAGIINSVQGDVYGMQIGGLLNRSNQIMGSQLSLGLNWADGDLKGTQIGGIGNLAEGSAHSAQIGGLFNQTKGSTNFQLSSAYNHASKVDGSQISAGLNTAKKVRGTQIGAVNKAKSVSGLQLGLVNFADTLKGVSLGLINIIKEGGFNKLEVASNEALHVVVSAKIGAQQLYHIYQGSFSLFGKRWGIGGGLGSSIPLNQRWDMNMELTAMHINETAKWSPTLNLFTNGRYLFEYKMESGFSFFMGPSLNVMISKYVHPDTQQIGSDLPMYSFFNHTSSKGVNTQLWMGAVTGLRLNLW